MEISFNDHESFCSSRATVITIIIIENYLASHNYSHALAQADGKMLILILENHNKWMVTVTKIVTNLYKQITVAGVVC